MDEDKNVMTGSSDVDDVQNEKVKKDRHFVPKKQNAYR